MATAMKPPMPRGDSEKEPTHTYYADADVLSADFEEPVHEKIKPRAQVTLSADGHYQFRQAEPFRLDGLISYRSGYTQVAGHRSPKHLHGFATLATSVVEDLNVLDVLTADRVVAQIFTEHPPYDPDNGQTDGVPTVSFLGTRFDNLRIDGHKVDIERDMDILGPKPADEKSYFEDSGVLNRISQQYANINNTTHLPDWANERYRWDQTSAQRPDKLKCSLVNRVTGAPGTPFGHVIDLPHFGKIFLAELTLRREKNGRPGPEKYAFHLTMIRLELGCPVQGTGSVANADSNGSGGSGGH
ncbi:MAG TPA: hypothetical protein VN950_15555 [Terriglobales bacterium]|nr:hypothetical protein [Terriglobales bacterium]